MKISKNKVVELSYELEVDGEVIDVAEESQPLDYIHGTNMLLPKFEAEVEGEEPGYEFDFIVEPRDGYGEYKKSDLVELPKSAFEVNGEVRDDLLIVGNIIPMLNDLGDVVRGVVKEIGEEMVTMDFNHPLAGKVLNFRGKVLTVREATEKELTEGLHGEFLPHECGCGCGGHGMDGDCCGGHGHHEDGDWCGGHGHHGDGDCCGNHDGGCCC